MKPAQGTSSRIWYAGDTAYRIYGVGAAQATRDQIIEVACTSQPLKPQRVECLPTLAENVGWGSIKIRDDLTRVANEIHGNESVDSVKKSELVQLAGRIVRQSTVKNTSLGLAMEIARARATRGAGCRGVVEDHGIQWNQAEVALDPQARHQYLRAQIAVQMAAVRGVAGARIEQGASCEVIAREHEIWSEEVIEALEQRAIRTVGRMMVERGDPFETIVVALGLTLEQSRMSLQYMIDSQHLRSRNMPTRASSQ